MNNAATPDHNPGYYRHDDLATVEARFDAFCAWHGCLSPALTLDDEGEILMTDELLAWFDEHGASLDWIFAGNPQGMAAAYRKANQKTPALVESLQIAGMLDDAEQRIVLTGLKFASEAGADTDQVMRLVAKQVTEYRAENAKAAAAAA